jgi:hypothetical protein
MSVQHAHLLIGEVDRLDNHLLQRKCSTGVPSRGKCLIAERCLHSRYVILTRGGYETREALNLTRQASNAPTRRTTRENLSLRLPSQMSPWRL